MGSRATRLAVEVLHGVWLGLGVSRSLRAKKNSCVVVREAVCCASGGAEEVCVVFNTMTLRY
jgi:hypothetical protein